MTPRLRRFALTAHVASSVGWLGAVAAFLPLSVVGLIGHDAETVRGAYLTMELIGWYALVPLSLASVVTGFVMSLGTAWGLFRHYWVLAKFVVATLSAIILLVYMPTLGSLAELAARTSPLDFESLRHPSPVLHASLALLALLATTALSVYRPWGRTRYGLRPLGRP
jgi:hypothetical protein